MDKKCGSQRAREKKERCCERQRHIRETERETDRDRDRRRDLWDYLGTDHLKMKEGG